MRFIGIIRVIRSTREIGRIGDFKSIRDKMNARRLRRGRGEKSREGGSKRRGVKVGSQLQKGKRRERR